MLSSLEGRKEDVTDDIFVNNNYSAICKGLQTNSAVMCSGDYGSITVYRDDDGKYRCEFNRCWVTHSHEKFEYKYQIKKWVNEWRHSINVMRTPPQVQPKTEGE